MRNAIDYINDYFGDLNLAVYKEIEYEEYQPIECEGYDFSKQEEHARFFLETVEQINLEKPELLPDTIGMIEKAECYDVRFPKSLFCDEFESLITDKILKQYDKMESIQKQQDEILKTFGKDSLIYKAELMVNQVIFSREQAEKIKLERTRSYIIQSIEG